MGKHPITSCEAAADDVTGIVVYSINGVPTSREDFVALQLARIAGALEADMVENDGEGGNDSSVPDLFGMKQV